MGAVYPAAESLECPMALARILFSILLVSAFGVANAQSIIFNTEEWYPYSYTDEDGTLKGTAVDVVKAVIEEIGMNPVIAVNSRTRSYNRALSRDGNCSFPSPMIGRHKIRFKWVFPVETNRWGVYKIKGGPFFAEGMEDLQDQKIGGFVGSTVTSYMRSQGVDMILLPRDEDGPKDLGSGKIDLWATTEFAARILSKRAGVKIEEVLEIRENILGIACNKNISDEAIVKMQEALDGVNASGTGDRIRRSKF